MPDDTYDVVRQPIEGDFMRDLGDNKTARGCRTVHRAPSPFEDNTTVVDRDQSMDKWKVVGGGEA